MKNIVLLLAVLISFNSNAALISISLDKSQYQLNETISGQLVVSEFTESLGGFWAQLNFDPVVLSMESWQFGNGFDDGLGSLQFDEYNESGGSLYLGDYSDLFADTNVLLANQGTEFVLASFTAKSNFAGSHMLTSNDFGLLNFDNDFVDVNFVPQNINVVNATQVPEPGTWLLMFASLLILGRSQFRKGKRF